MENYFDFIVIDPPFITREVWEKVFFFLSIILYNNSMLKQQLKFLKKMKNKNQFVNIY